MKINITSFKSLLSAIFIITAIIVIVIVNSTPETLMSMEKPTPLNIELQPQVTVIESMPPKRAHGSISIPEGSVWCQGRPTYWWVGHDNGTETPWCQEKDGSWIQPNIAVLDKTDSLNIIDGPKNIDRHDCTKIDANGDGILDLVCVVGANKGKGKGFNELYITQEDGSLKKIIKGHGLHKYPGMRTRFIRSLEAADGGKLIFIANRGIPREDGESNAHRMFRVAPMRDGIPFFEEVASKGPWTREFKASFVFIGDINNDNIDDIIVGDEDGPPWFFVQHSDLSWESFRPDNLRENIWNNVRVADVTKDGNVDLLVLSKLKGKQRHNSRISMYEGDSEIPFLFKFSKTYFEMKTAHEAIDLEVLDVNRDSLPDVYIVKRMNYKEIKNATKDPWWTLEKRNSVNIVPPLDTIQDILLLGNNKPNKFSKITMKHSEPGYGSHVRKWGNNSLLLAQGDLTRIGHNLILEWK